MDLIIIIILFCCCCCCIILSGGGYYYITNSSSKITSEQLPTTKQLPSSSGQSSNTSGQSSNTSEQSPNILGQSTFDQLQITTTIKPITTTPIPVIKWVICGSDNKGLPSIAYSYDGKLWTETKSLIPDTGSSNSFESIAYNGKIWIAVGPNDFKIASSTDGINWILNNYKNYAGSGYDICWGNSLWVTVGKKYDTKGIYYGCIITSKDGLDWSEIKGNFPILYSVKYNPDINVWVAAGADKIFIYSTDGIKWENIDVKYLDFDYNQDINSINVINSQFFATVITNSSNVILSSGGKIWKSSSSGRISYINPEKIILFNNIMIVGGGGKFHLEYSSDLGKTWIGSVPGEYFSKIEDNNSKLGDTISNITKDIATNNSDIVLAVGYLSNQTINKAFGQILTSTDGKNWTTSKVTFMSRINGVASNIPL